MTKQTGYAPVHNGELFYAVDGDANAPAVIFIHACICDHSLWDPQIAAFAKHYHVLRFDQRGHGASRTQDTEYSRCRDVLDVMKHVGIEKAVMIGCSCGGQLALDLAVAHPERVSGVVWVCGGLSGLPWPPPDLDTWEEMKQVEILEALTEAKKMDELADAETHMWVNGLGQAKDRASAAIYRRVLQTVKASQDRKDGKAKEIPINPTAIERLSALKIPMLLVIGGLDVESTQWSASHILKGLPSAQKVVFEDAAHLPSAEQPNRFNKVVLEFLGNAI
jgi:pimeloyl-ACP methyl ester carboxylesterase